MKLDFLLYVSPSEKFLTTVTTLYCSWTLDIFHISLSISLVWCCYCLNVSDSDQWVSRWIVCKWINPQSGKCDVFLAVYGWSDMCSTNIFQWASSQVVCRGPECIYVDSWFTPKVYNYVKRVCLCAQVLFPHRKCESRTSYSCWPLCVILCQAFTWISHGNWYLWKFLCCADAVFSSDLPSN